MKKQTTLLVFGLFAVSAALLAAPPDRTSQQPIALTEGISSQEALTALTAVLKQVPTGDTILSIRFVNTRKIQVRVCGKDTSRGCTLNYEKTGTEWKLGIMAHWRSERAAPADAKTRR